MPQVVQWPPVPGTQAHPEFPVAEACRQQLGRGELVVLPTEAGYIAAASGLQAEAVARLAGRRTAPEAPLPTVAVRGEADARDWFPNWGPVARRFARRGWPGPLTLVLVEGANEGVASQLPEGVLRAISPGGRLGLTAPRHPTVRQLSEVVTFPLVVAELATADGRPANTAAQAQSLIGDAAVVIDAGSIDVARGNTIVEIGRCSWTVRRQGLTSTEEVNRLAARMVLFVCTGNTCRSPLAAALCQKQLADRLGCTVDELPGRGFVVASAGLAALRGEPAAVEAVNVAGELGADLTGHASRPASPDLLAAADLIVGMTSGHLDGLAGVIGPDTKIRLLCGDMDLPDPIGGDVGVYQNCASTIWQHLPKLVDELVSGEEAAQA